MEKMYKFCLQNSMTLLGGLTVPPIPPAGFCSHESSWPDWLFFGGYGPDMIYVGLDILVKNNNVINYTL